MRLLLAALLLLGGLSAAQAQVKIDGADITGAGLIKLGKTKNIDDALISTGQRTESPDATLTKQTTVIPATLNTVFGVTVMIRGHPKGKSAAFRIVWRYPAPGLRNPATGVTKLDDQYSDNRTLGAVSTFYWNLSEDWTLVPGEWDFEIWDGNRQLAKQAFTLQK